MRRKITGTNTKQTWTAFPRVHNVCHDFHIAFNHGSPITRCTRQTRTRTQLHPRSPTEIYQNTVVVTQMSTSNQITDPSTSNFTAIFDAALQEYKSLTKKDLATHPLAAAIEGYNTPDSILNVSRKQASAFDKFRKGDDKLMEGLTPIVNILFTFSETLGEGVGLVSLHSVQYVIVL